MRVREELERYGADADYFDQHRQELLRLYPDRWVGVYNQQVVGAAKDIKRLIKQLERRGIEPGRVYREFVTDKEEVLILHSPR